LDITAATAVSMNQLRVQNDLTLSVLKKTVDMSTQQGSDLAKLVDQSGGVGKRVDLFA